MAFIKLETEIHAPIERCFDLSRSIDLHVNSTSKTKEEAIAGKTAGLIGLGEFVTWKATHFCITQNLTTRITALKSSVYFIDEMEKGIFKNIIHRHIFKDNHASSTTMIDEFQYEVPFGFIGKLLDAVVLKNYLTKFLKERNAVIKDCAETDKWKIFLKS